MELIPATGRNGHGRTGLGELLPIEQVQAKLRQRYNLPGCAYDIRLWAVDSLKQLGRDEPPVYYLAFKQPRLVMLLFEGPLCQKVCLNTGEVTEIPDYQVEEAELNCHNYTKQYRAWGHDYSLVKKLDELGHKWEVLGFGEGVEKGHRILLDNQTPYGTRYKVESIKYMQDPSDMWQAVLRFDPRTAKE
jgi:hypothetical protein